MKKINILEIGAGEYLKAFNIPKHVELVSLDKIVPEKKEYEILFLTRNITQSEANILRRMSKAYAVFYVEGLSLDAVTNQFLDTMCGKMMPEQDLQKFLDEESEYYFSDSYGEKLSQSRIGIKPEFSGKVYSEGRWNNIVEGDFGNNFSQIMYNKDNYPIYVGQTIEIWIEYEKDPTVEIMLKVRLNEMGSVDKMFDVMTFSENQMKDLVLIKNTQIDAFMSFSIFARGHGKLNIKGIHSRYSRNGLGSFIVGAKRYVTSAREEIFAYFEPGDFKPPLTVYFSGHKTREGFEGYYMMKSMGTPFLLIAEQRLAGGGFYLGDEEYEHMMVDILEEYINKLGFSKNQVILSGISMGSSASLYYGAKLKPHALILGKPLANLGNVAANERLNRPGGFPESLDVLLKNTGSISREGVDILNTKMWNSFEKTDWGDTKIIVSYLYEDDYDNETYDGMLTKLADTGVEIYSKGSHGRHNDNTESVVAWFKGQYLKLLRENFGRNN